MSRSTLASGSTHDLLDSVAGRRRAAIGRPPGWAPPLGVGTALERYCRRRRAPPADPGRCRCTCADPVQPGRDRVQAAAAAAQFRPSPRYRRAGTRPAEPPALRRPHLAAGRLSGGCHQRLDRHRARRHCRLLRAGVDMAIMRLADLWMAMPGILLAMVFIFTLGPSLTNV